MKRLSTRCVAFLCVVACATVGAVEVWSVAQQVQTEDHNGDGRPDTWRRYDSRGQLSRVDVDSNFDGRPDIEEYYERGVLIRRESDRNFNGQTDLVEEFDAETHAQTRSVIDSDYDGTADLLVLFRDGRPVFWKRTCSSKAAGNPIRSSSRDDENNASHLARLTDPFDSDVSLRAMHTGPSADGCVGLSTCGGLPRPSIAAVSPVSPSARLLARDVQPPTLTLLRHRSPRAPPIS